MSELREFSVEDLSEMVGWDIRDWFMDEKIESGVFRIEVGCRGEIEDISKVEVKDGVFEVESVEEIMNNFDEEDRESMEEWVDVEMFEGVLSVCKGEEDNVDIVKLVVD